MCMRNSIYKYKTSGDYVLLTMIKREHFQYLELYSFVFFAFLFNIINIANCKLFIARIHDVELYQD